MVELLRHQATANADAVAFTYLRDGERDEVSWTFAELDRQARRVAAALQSRGVKRGQRILLLHPQGLDYIAALFGSMYAGVLAIPLQPPSRHRAKLAVPKLEAIVADGGVELAATVSGLVGEMREVVAGTDGLADIPWLATDTLDGIEDDWEPLPLGGDDLAYLQYTSGSTSLPKGVMVSHGNLLYNLRDFDDGYDHADGVMVSWLPTFHDLGLVYGVFMPVFRAMHGVLLDPLQFLRRPLRWMEAISRFGGTHSPAPNFAFDLVAAKSTAEERAALDLSRWRIALNGAEPIRHDTEARFVEAFASAGVTWKTLSHAYGMSESTAVIAKELVGTDPVFAVVDGTAMEQHQIVRVADDHPAARIVAGCGVTTNETVVRIVEPESKAVCEADRVGEIWVGGPTRAKGYWNKPEASAETFEAYTADGEGPFLRTGDLGFLADGNVFVTGRLKDMIIIRGENHYAQDLEWTTQQACAAVRPSCVAAFTRGDDAQLVLVAEVYPDRVGDEAAAFGAIRDAISDHGLQVQDIAFIQPRAIFKTSTGKIMRRRTRAALDAGEFDLVARWTAEVVAAPEPSGTELVAALSEAPEAARADVLIDHILVRAGAMLGLPGDALDPDVPMRELGFDSVQAVDLADELSKDLGFELATTVLFDHPTAEDLASHILDEWQDAAPAPAVDAPTADDDDDLEALLAAELEGL
jgi:acyl-CoA synthetase (AMP-forming)/AMP-acid ligase II/acyl carrier protein